MQNLMNHFQKKSPYHLKANTSKGTFILVGPAITYFEDSTHLVLPVCLNWKREAVPTDNLVSVCSIKQNDLLNLQHTLIIHDSAAFR